ncbi:hypothetical protein VNI00_016848 [Paramarasmius palmivorus]|uniref:HNH nuclease domain-containing protein n=1 Tax=Paramarasmius palmivorus TaxID=297713 RepID=A0AAW0BAJ2_9AGAR
MFVTPHPLRPSRYGDSSVDIYIAIAIDPSQDIDSPENRRWSDKPLLSIPKTFIHSLDLAGNNWVPWLRYVSYAVSGQPGFISLNHGGPPLKTSLNLLDTSANASVFYHPKSHILCFIDPKLPSYATSSCAGSAREGFRDKVIARDHGCVWTRAGPSLCDAAHIVRHGKTLAYVKRLLQTRATDETFDSIDDPRNGLLLNKVLHVESENGVQAYIRTPIPHIIDSSDLHSNSPPHQDILTVHYIHGDVYDPDFTISLPPNEYVVTPGDTDTAPSHVLLDAVYGAHLFTKFGNEKLALEMFPDREKQHYGPYGPMKKGGKTDKAKRERQTRDRDVRTNEGLEYSDYDSNSDLEMWTPPQTFQEASPMDKLLMIRSRYVTFKPGASVETEDAESLQQSPLRKGQFEGKNKEIDIWRHEVKR